MNCGTLEKLACSLTAESTELVPFLPYLLQDFWSLGSDPDVIARLIEKHLSLSDSTKILDLACGKGAVSIQVAEKLRVRTKGVDLIPDFIEYASKKANEHALAHICEFQTGDINETVKIEKDYDCVIFGAAGSVLGNHAETLEKLKAVIKTEGYILIDESFLPEDGSQEDIQFDYYKYLTQKQWGELVKDLGLEIVETVFSQSSGSDPGIAAITQRCHELIEKHPDKRAIFEGYIRSQQNEYDDIDNNLSSATWILRKL